MPHRGCHDSDWGLEVRRTDSVIRRAAGPGILQSEIRKGEKVALNEQSE